MHNLTPSSNSNPHVYSSIEHKIAHERIRQARNSSNLALVATATATAISIVGTIAFLSGKVPEGAITTGGGLTASAICFRLNKDANDRLDKLLSELNDEG
jgi:hypothetical protein